LLNLINTSTHSQHLNSVAEVCLYILQFTILEAGGKLAIAVQLNLSNDWKYPFLHFKHNYWDSNSLDLSGSKSISIVVIGYPSTVLII